MIYDLNWTAEELAIMKSGGSVSVIVNGTVFEARMPRDEDANDRARIDRAYEMKALPEKKYGKWNAQR